MFNLVKNELIKIFKRKNIYILFLLALIIIFGYNIFEKSINSNLNISEQYVRDRKSVV